ncbi:MAG: tRNA (cytidine(34)-2'-O)-methyltransferase [Oscillospiraceae bacterium]|nr:tRNA (cytidine(34)-2'-O)-methyltransferase [Oscillospiraceae bacterium]
MAEKDAVYTNDFGINIVLHEPEIPQNTGNIVRTCAAVGAGLHLISPLGFSIEDRYLKRAGLDYWDKLNLSCYDSYGELIGRYPGADFYYFTTKGDKYYYDLTFTKGCFIVFGKETAGLPVEILGANPGRLFRIPMLRGIRSLNLSNSVAIVVYEAMRQNGFDGLV